MSIGAGTSATKDSQDSKESTVTNVQTLTSKSMKKKEQDEGQNDSNQTSILKGEPDGNQKEQLFDVYITDHSEETTANINMAYTISE